MFEKLKLPFAAICVAAILCLSVFASNADAQRVIPSMGVGPYEVLMFSDYFCPPCKQIDTKAEPLMKELLASGKVKITFADVPFHRFTPVYARYYLYAVNAGANNEEIFRIRKIIFQAAQEKRIETSEALLGYLKEQKIIGKSFDEKPVFSMLSAMIKENKVDNTPTCVIKYSSMDVKKYVGTEEIWIGLTKLKTHLATVKK
jgi:protein-disulfide isomerase